MHITTIAFFSAAAAVMAAPSAPILAPKIWTATSSDGNVVPAGIKDQCDGFYLAVFNGTELDHVEFTPLNDGVKPLTSADVSVRQPTALELEERAGTTCGNRYTSNLNDLTNANIQLAQNGDRKWYDPHAWGWVHIGQETSFFCNYEGNWLTYDLIIDMQTVVSNVCGEDGYGHDRRTNSPQGPRDLAVGRTYRGNEFCAGGFTG